MEKEIGLIWKKRSLNSIAGIYKYIAKNNPRNAEKLIQRMYGFGENLTILPEKFAPCRFEKFAQRGYYCAIFEKNFIFFYSIKKNTVYICNVIRVSRLK